MRDLIRSGKRDMSTNLRLAYVVGLEGVMVIDDDMAPILASSSGDEDATLSSS